MSNYIKYMMAIIFSMGLTSVGAVEWDEGVNEIDHLFSQDNDRGFASDLEFSLKKNRRAKKSKKWGLNVIMLYNSASHVGTTTNSAGQQTYNNYNTTIEGDSLARYTGEYRSSASFAIGVEYSKQRLLRAGKFGFGFDLGTMYEADRTVSRDFVNPRNYSYSGTSGGLANQSGFVSGSAYSSDPTVSFFLPYANANVTYRNTYAFTGVNYSFPNVNNAPEEDFSSMLGYQVGVGAKINSYASIEMAQRWVKFGAQSKYIDRYQNRNGLANTSTGFGVISKETLTVAGITVNLKLMF